MKIPMQRVVTLAAALALTGATALVISPSASAAPPVGDFSAPTITGLKKKIKLKKKSQAINFAVSFTGTYDDKGSTDTNGDGAAISYRAYDSEFHSATIKRIKTVESKKHVSMPYVRTPITDVTTTSNGGFTINVSSVTSPGLYEVRVPITQVYRLSSGSTMTTHVAVQRFKVVAPKKFAKRRTSLSVARWKIGATAKFNVVADASQRGAKVKLYFKPDGKKKKYAVVGKGKLKKSKSYTTLVEGAVKTKKITRAGKVYLKVRKVKYSAGYKTKPVKITISRY